MNLNKIGLQIILSIGLSASAGYANNSSGVGTPYFNFVGRAAVASVTMGIFQSSKDASDWCIVKAASPSLVCQSQKSDGNKGIHCSFGVEIAPIYHSINDEVVMGAERNRLHSVVATAQDLENGKIKNLVDGLNTDFDQALNNANLREKLLTVKDAFKSVDKAARLIDSLIYEISTKSCEHITVTDTFTKTEQSTILTNVGECLPDYHQYERRQEYVAKFTLTMTKNEKYITYAVNPNTKTVDLSKKLNTVDAQTRFESKLIDDSRGKSTPQDALDECESKRSKFLPLVNQKINSEILK